MNTELIAIISSGILGLASIVVAGLAAFWAKQARIEPIKQRLYDEQIRASSECVKALIDLQIDVLYHHEMMGYSKVMKSVDRQQFITMTENDTKRFKKTLYQWSYILPSRVYLPMVRYLSVIEYVAGMRVLFDGWPGASYASEIPWSLLASNFLDSIAQIREFLNIDPLSSDLSESLDVQNEKLKKEIDSKTQYLGYLMSHDYRPLGSYQDGYLFDPSEQFGPQGQHEIR